VILFSEDSTMTRRELASLCVRLLGIISILMAIGVLGITIPMMVANFQYFEGMSKLGMFVGSVIGPGLLLIAGIILWKKAGSIASLITGHDLQDESDEPEVVRIDVGIRDVHAVAFSILGLWTLLSVLPDAASLIATVVFSESDLAEDFSTSLIRFAMREILTIVPRLILGIWLLMGARGLVNWLHRIRNIGLEDHESTDTSRSTIDDADDA
jgi:hypothetical protein